MAIPQWGRSRMSRAGRGRPRQPQKRRESPRLDAWRRSARCKAVALRALEIADSVRAAMPRCGAKRKRDGEPCTQIALENGRCRFHGGRTPKGAQWHKIRMPAKGEVRGVEKFEAKLAAKEKREARRRPKLAAMNEEKRARHERWQQAHAPGSPSQRAHRRQQRETKSMIDKLIGTDSPTVAKDRGKNDEVDVFA